MHTDIAFSTLTLQNNPRLILLNPHLLDVLITKAAMRRMPALKAATTRPEVVRATETIAVQAGEELRGGVAVKVGWAERVGGDIPAGPEPEEVGEGSIRVVGFGG